MGRIDLGRRKTDRMMKCFGGLSRVMPLVIAGLYASLAVAQEDGSQRISLSGALAEGQEGSATISEIEAAGLHEFTLFNPYDQREDLYAGVFISDLVEKFGAEGARSVTLIALDDYTIDFSREEWDDFGIVLSTRMNGDYFGFDMKGPMRVVFPDYDGAKLEYQETLPKWIWMITRIEFKK
ncbi:hypothetical protein [Thalassovita aquimarina]|uniref:Oxidoreductase molybdopterin-binding domain-containing protein n=1 Tax=Thalassovita aquimarina TaxID=2785917 RepID=A0ABS5HSY5_9RHOB|nr:hypothetical protein [Thalassovita aquimarina]MBR9652097.1 hypothetical protein [Thalassovita aquimarina]